MGGVARMESGNGEEGVKRSILIYKTIWKSGNEEIAVP